MENKQIGHSFEKGAFIITLGMLAVKFFGAFFKVAFSINLLETFLSIMLLAIKTIKQNREKEAKAIHQPTLSSPLIDNITDPVTSITVKKPHPK